MRRALRGAAQAGRATTALIERALRSALIGVVKGYRLLLSPMLGAGCRFTPTCSAYALQALERHGAGRGSVLTLNRLARCHPWCEGGHDEVPDVPGRGASPGPQAPTAASGRSARLFSRLLPPSSHKTLND